MGARVAPSDHDPTPRQRRERRGRVASSQRSSRRAEAPPLLFAFVLATGVATRHGGHTGRAGRWLRWPGEVVRLLVELLELELAELHDGGIAVALGSVLGRGGIGGDRAETHRADRLAVGTGDVDGDRR